MWAAFRTISPYAYDNDVIYLLMIRCIFTASVWPVYEHTAVTMNTTCYTSSYRQAHVLISSSKSSYSNTM